MKMVQDYYDAKSSEDSAEELNKIDREEILTVTINGSSDAKERRKRREIANSNERRRMQSINAGFQTLRGLLPGNRAEKLSKAAILQKTADLIYQLRQDKMRMIRERNELKDLLTRTAISPLKRPKSYLSNFYQYRYHHRQQHRDSDDGNSTISGNSRLRHHPYQRYEHHQSHLVESMSSDECFDDCLDDCLSPDEDPVSPIAHLPMDILVERPSSDPSSRSSLSSLSAAADFNSSDMVEELHTKLFMERSHRLRLEDQIRHMDPNMYYPHPPEVHHVEEVLSNNSVDRSDDNDAPNNTPIEIGHFQQQTVPNKTSPAVGVTNAAVAPTTASSSIMNLPLLPSSTSVTTVTNLPLISPPVSSLPSTEITAALPFTLQTPQLSPQPQSPPPSSSSLYGSCANGASILEAVLKCEPKVEVESLLTVKSRSSPSLPSQLASVVTTTTASGASLSVPVVSNVNNLPRQNLETIVKAIRHLEGDMFSNKEQEQPQQRPGVIVTQQKQPQPEQQKSQSPFI